MTRRHLTVSEKNAQRLDDIYAKLPNIECAGRCWDSCGPIDMSRAERKRIAAQGVDIPPGRFRDVGPKPCVALALGRCSVYDIRPLICRIWGLTKRMPCSYGCVPERWITEAEAFELIAQAYDVGGQTVEAAASRLAASPEHEATAARVRNALDVEAALIIRRLGAIGELDPRDGERWL